MLQQAQKNLLQAHLAVHHAVKPVAAPANKHPVYSILVVNLLTQAGERDFPAVSWQALMDALQIQILQILFPRLRDWLLSKGLSMKL